MPIYEQSYRRYEARAPLTRLRFWPITRAALERLARQRVLLLLLGVAWLPLVLRIAQIAIVSRIQEAARLAPADVRLFGDFFGWQVWFAIVLSVFGGAGLVAEDLRTGGMLVYLSRPLTRQDYILGKLGVVLALNLSVTLVPALLLYLAALGIAPEQYLNLHLAWIAPAIVAQSLAISLAIGLPLLAASALTPRAWVAGVGFFALVVVLGLAHVILSNAMDAPGAILLSLTGALDVLANALFGSGDASPVPWTAALAVLAALGAAAFGVLRARVRAVEIVR
jgi:ABC-2 type transport system permease protein